MAITDLNVEGLTYATWMIMAGREHEVYESGTDTIYRPHSRKWRREWRKGVDPGEWRADNLRERAEEQRLREERQAERDALRALEQLQQGAHKDGR